MQVCEVRARECVQVREVRARECVQVREVRARECVQVREVKVRESVCEVRVCTNVWEVCSVCVLNPLPPPGRSWSMCDMWSTGLHP